MTKAEAAKLVGFLLGAFPSASVTEKTSLVYEQLLADLDFSAAQLAVNRLARTKRFLPTIAEIREAALEIVHGPKRLGGEAWGDVLAEIRRVGAYDLPRFEDPAVAEAVRLMGWRGLCLGDNETSDRARFVELYEGLQDRARTDVQAGHALPPAKGLAGLPKPSGGGPVAIGQLVGRRS